MRFLLSIIFAFAIFISPAMALFQLPGNEASQFGTGIFNNVMNVPELIDFVSELFQNLRFFFAAQDNSAALFP